MRLLEKSTDILWSTCNMCTLVRKLNVKYFYSFLTRLFNSLQSFYKKRGTLTPGSLEIPYFKTL